MRREDSEDGETENENSTMTNRVCHKQNSRGSSLQVCDYYYYYYYNCYYFLWFLLQLDYLYTWYTVHLHVWSNTGDEHPLIFSCLVTFIIICNARDESNAIIIIFTYLYNIHIFRCLKKSTFVI